MSIIQNQALPDIEDILDNAVDESLEEEGLTPSGKKLDLEDLNNRGRSALDKSELTLQASANQLAHLMLNADSDAVKARIAMMAFERHAGKLTSDVGNNNSVEINIIGGDVVIEPGKKSLFNPTPVVDVEAEKVD